MNRSSSSPVRPATVTGLVSGLVVGLVVALVVAVALPATASTPTPSPSGVRHAKAGRAMTLALVARATLSADFIAPGRHQAPWPRPPTDAVAPSRARSSRGSPP